MRISILILLYAVTSYASAQKIHFNVKGSVDDTSSAKFAYLTTLSHQVTISSDSLFLKVPITNGKFNFTGTFDLNGNDYQNACVFIDERSNISKSEIQSKFRQLVWVVGRESNIKHIILEDIDLGIISKNKMNVAQIVSDGILTKQLYEQFAATNAGDKKLLDFIKKYPNSPISFNTVVELNSLIAKSYNRERLENAWGTVPELFAALSIQLKNSKRG